MSKRNVLLRNESYNDFIQELAKSDMEKEDFVKQRLKANGWTEEQESKFERHCKVVGFRLPS